MEAILNELGLGILKERFEAERIKPKVVACLSDGILASLGVSTIGDRIRLRELCRNLLEKSKNETDDERKNYRERVREEGNHLFQPNRSSSSGRGRKRKSACPQAVNGMVVKISGFVRGPPNTVPEFVTFQQDFKKGALLTVCWSDGSVSFIPLLFSPSSHIGSPSAFENGTFANSLSSH